VSAAISGREPRKYKPLLPPPAISPIATASEEQKNNDDNKNEIHSFLQNISWGHFPYTWLWNNYSTSVGIYLVADGVGSRGSFEKRCLSGGGTEGSNPLPSSSQSVSAVTP